MKPLKTGPEDPNPKPMTVLVKIKQPEKKVIINDFDALAKAAPFPHSMCPPENKKGIPDNKATALTAFIHRSRTLLAHH